MASCRLRARNIHHDFDQERFCACWSAHRRRFEQIARRTKPTPKTFGSSATPAAFRGVCMCARETRQCTVLSNSCCCCCPRRTCVLLFTSCVIDGPNNEVNLKTPPVRDFLVFLCFLSFRVMLLKWFWLFVLLLLLLLDTKTSLITAEEVIIFIRIFRKRLKINCKAVTRFYFYTVMSPTHLFQKLTLRCWFFFFRSIWLYWESRYTYY